MDAEDPYRVEQVRWVIDQVCPETVPERDRARVARRFSKQLHIQMSDGTSYRRLEKWPQEYLTGMADSLNHLLGLEHITNDLLLERAVEFSTCRATTPASTSDETPLKLPPCISDETPTLPSSDEPAATPAPTPAAPSPCACPSAPSAALPRTSSSTATQLAPPNVYQPLLFLMAPLIVLATWDLLIGE